MASRFFSRSLSRLGNLNSACSNATLHIRPKAVRLVSTISPSKDPEEDGDLAEKIKAFGTYIPVLSENPLQQGTSHIPRKGVPAYIPRPAYAHPNYRAPRPPPYRGDGLVKLGTADELKARRAGALAAMALQEAESLVKPGITSEEIDDQVHDFILSHGAYPSPLNYPSPEGSYPKSTCISINNCIIHGIPDTRELEDGDLLNIDITVYLDGFHGDTSNTVLVGNVDPQGQYLAQLATRALYAGISVCRPDAYFKDIGKTIHNLTQQAEEETGEPFAVSPHFTGHGIGRDFHRPPWIVHTVNEEPGIMKPGHCFTIEPAIIQGRDPDWWMLPDGWTILSERQVEAQIYIILPNHTSISSYARAAQAEHTILITETGADILTNRETAKATFDKYKP
ncbi:unnamed protein product [Rhizoctonia solani]|uniref:Methionine aminopeptidase n=1 Tax=Rhizoctonia solani TaxID=456999 RepID=A0A8H3HQM6_9AGAM|nr:unnamed protein product [Rhizoctonia solani]